MDWPSDITPTPEFEAAIRFLAEEDGHLFVTGRAGTGKSTLLKAIRDWLGEQAAVLAPTGLAAVNVGGQTIHSFFGFPPRLIRPDDIRRSRNGRVMRRLDALIIDEVSMVRSDLMWAIDQSLRSSAVAAVWGNLDRIDDSDARRLQLAAETGGTLGLFLRPPQAIREPSWAEVRMHVRGSASAQQASSSRRLSLRVLRVRDGRPGQQIMLEIDQQTGNIRQVTQRDRTTSTQRLAAELARPAVANRQRARRA